MLSSSRPSCPLRSRHLPHHSSRKYYWATDKLLLLCPSHKMLMNEIKMIIMLWLCSSIRYAVLSTVTVTATAPTVAWVLFSRNLIATSQHFAFSINVIWADLFIFVQPSPSLSMYILPIHPSVEVSLSLPSVPWLNQVTAPPHSLSLSHPTPFNLIAYHHISFLCIIMLQNDKFSWKIKFASPYVWNVQFRINQFINSIKEYLFCSSLCFASKSKT